jgi:hypothetical protein
MSRFEHIPENLSALAATYRRKGFGRVLGKQGGDRQSENRSIKKGRSPPT